MKKNICIIFLTMIFMICSINAYSPHLSVKIDGNAGLASNSSQGKGTSDNPYIIENLEIKSSTGKAGIYISHTTAFFIIRNCYIHDEPDSGIELNAVSNGSIRDCIIEKTGYIGVHINECKNITITNNEIKENGDGGCIEVYNSSGVNIENNNLARSGKDNILLADPYEKGLSVD